MHPTLVNTIPFTRINDTSFIKDQSINSIINRCIPSLKVIDNKANSIDTRYQFELIQQGFLYIVTETVFDYPCTVLTEKSFKGITAKRPFVIFGAPGSLSKLKDFGFKTFDTWWDEEYDNISDPEKRFLKIFDIVSDISVQSIDSLKTLCSEMETVLEYNFNWYKNYFYQTELDKFNNQLENLFNV